MCYDCGYREPRKADKPLMSVATVRPDEWYQYDSSDIIVCGECALEDLQKTAQGKLTGEEVITLDMIEKLPNPGTEAYQCDGCLTQSEGYDSVLDD